MLIVGRYRTFELPVSCAYAGVNWSVNKGAIVNAKKRHNNGKKTLRRLLLKILSTIHLLWI